MKLTRIQSKRIIRLFDEFFRRESSSGIVLMFIAALAMLWANSAWGGEYQDLWHWTPPGLLSLTLHEWVNDGLMAVFFFVVGLEIKREFVGGELSTLKQAILPLLAALGGMLIPALIYFCWNPFESPGMTGWGIPTVTDIAFSLGILALLGSRVPLGLKVFLSALAIVDDLGAVVLISVFYTTHLVIPKLLAALGVFLVLMGLNHFARLQCRWIYLAGAVLLWFCFLHSGIHPTVAGVLAAFTVPAVKDTLVEDLTPDDDSDNSTLHRLETMLHPWSSYLVLPLFALANAGIRLEAVSLDVLLSNPVTWGIVLGLVLGKQVGVTLFSFIPIRLGWASLPEGVSAGQLYAVSWLTGIGFTMSLFIAGMAFPEHSELSELGGIAKMSIFAASIIAAVGGLIVLNRVLKKQ